MGTIAQLNAEIGVNLQPLEQGLAAAGSALQGFGQDVASNVGQASAGLAELYQQLDNLQAAQARLPASSANYLELGASIEVVTQEINKLEVAQVREISIAQQVDALDRRLTQDALAKAAAEKEAAQATAQATTSSQTLTTALSGASKAFGFLRQAAYLIPGIGIAGIFNLIFEGVQKAAEATGLFADKTKQATQAEREFNEEMNRAATAAGQQIAKVSELVEVLNDQSINLTDKNKALKELKSINETYFGDLKIESGLVTGLATAYQAYAENIFRVAKAKGAEGELTKLGTSLVAVTQQFNDANDRLNQLSQKQSFFGADKVKKNYEELGNILKNDFLTLEQLARVQELTGLTERQINDLIGARTQARTQELRILGRMSELSKLVATNDIGKIVGGGSPEKINQVEQTLRKLQADLLAIQQLGTLNKTPLINIQEDQLKAMQAALKRLFELGLNEQSIPIQKLTLDIKNLQFQIDPNGLQKTEALAKLLPKNPNTFLTNPNEALDRQLATAAALTKQLEDQQNANKKKRQKEQENDLKASLAREVKLYEGLGNAIKNTFEGVFDTLITKGKLSFEGIGQALEKLLVQLAATAAEAAILSLILSTVTGGADIAAGLGAKGTGFASLFKALIPHAEGGYFAGPTLIGNHVFGEKGPEAVLPLNGNLGKLGGSMQPVVLETRIAGNDLVLVQNRQNRYNRRNYGNFAR